LHFLQVLIDWPSEHLTSISGTYGNFSTLLTITSLPFTADRANYGPFGTGSGTPFSIPINNNTVVGFHGRAGHHLATPWKTKECRNRYKYFSHNL